MPISTINLDFRVLLLMMLWRPWSTEGALLLLVVVMSWVVGIIAVVVVICIIAESSVYNIAHLGLRLAVRRAAAAVVTVGGADLGPRIGSGGPAVCLELADPAAIHFWCLWYRWSAGMAAEYDILCIL